MKGITFFVLLVMVLKIQEVGAEKKENSIKAFYSECCKRHAGGALPFSCAVPGTSVPCFTVHLPVPHKEEDHEPEDDEHEEDELAEVEEDDEDGEEVDEDDGEKDKPSDL